MRTRRTLVALSLVAALTLPVAPSAAQPTSQPIANDYPALRKRLAELTAEVERLTAALRRAESENAQLRSEVAAAKPATRPAGVAGAGGRRFNFGVGWEGPIGSARVREVIPGHGAILEIHDPKSGGDLGVVWVVDLDTSDLANGQEFADPTTIRVDSVTASDRPMLRAVTVKPSR